MHDELNQEPGSINTDHIEIRTLKADDLDWVVNIDSQHFQRHRREYYRVKIAEGENDTGLRISLAATIKGEPAGFLMGRLYYGEFGPRP